MGELGHRTDSVACACLFSTFDMHVITCINTFYTPVSSGSFASCPESRDLRIGHIIKQHLKLVVKNIDFSVLSTFKDDAAAYFGAADLPRAYAYGSKARCSSNI